MLISYFQAFFMKIENVMILAAWTFKGNTKACETFDKISRVGNTNHTKGESLYA